MSSNIRIAKNTIFLYARMICSVCINLYASRIILEALGIEDFGIYNLVAGVVTMLAFLNTTMAGCTSRFLTYELGRGDMSKLQKTFSSSVLVHLLIALVILILGETIGLWFINTQLVFPESKTYIVNWVYQFSLLSSVISVIQVPYSADVIAHEHMGFYAFIEILKVSFKLGASFLVLYFFDERMIVYSALLLLSAILLCLIYVIYCNRCFNESISTPRLHKDIIKPMLGFISWDLYGNASVIGQQQGVNVLINRFFGAVLNAASGVATQASSAVSMFVTSFTMALRPPIIKKYASGDMAGLHKLLLLSIIICVFLAEMVCLPLYLHIDSLMALWLTEIPPYAVSFCKWMLLANAIGIINSLFNIVIHATGNIKLLSLISGSIYLSTVVFSYIAFKLSYPPEVAYVILFFVTIGVLINNILIARKQVPTLPWLRLLTELLLPVTLLIVTVFLSILLNLLLPSNILGVILLFFINACIAVLLLYMLWFVPRFGWNPINVIKHEG